ncbi:hypothetical protein ES703_94757 [subsurface metagenome]
MSNKARGTYTATDSPSQGGELHPARGHFRKLPIYRHYPVTQGKDSGNTLTAATGGHRVVYYAVEVIMVYLTPGSLINKLIYPLPLSISGINGFSLLYRLIRSSGVNFISSLTIHPVVGTAKAGSLWANGTNMTRGKGLAQSTGVVNISSFIGHTLNTSISNPIYCLCLLHYLMYLVLLGIQFYLHFIKYPTKILMQLGMDDGANMIKPETFFYSRFTNPQPGNISLPDVHHSLSIVYQMMDLSLQDRLVVILHISAGDLNSYG